ncbi:pyridoxal phosphate-dependent aminotransferase [Bifidobacterium sp.]|jgi:aminotransferase|uniref:pyridoxal phosphate-dependent aminotransferase n=1 Tax=Bifidobacterium sp. TaxID=41200 RepID=UPI0025BF7108|nr:pyridoxal phosphate-dependent aminotransferase [Bifidobacterium sp.]MCH4209757.1 pyridoxal phosphate-dependent aminotransferase [Bifidobacterium sp.]MCI1224919.1 pyridoxal phosphate-dependent aminotransferase [Bifidobacterium sp.]
MPVIAQHIASIPRSGIRAVFDQVEAYPDAISLCVGEPSETAAPHIVDAACDSIRRGQTKYTNVLGIEEFREAAARYNLEAKGIRYDPAKEIQATAGATFALFLALKAVADPGDEVIIPSPFFTSYAAETLLCGAKPVTVALRPEHRMQLNADDIEAAITPRTRAVIINSPGNPTGAVTPHEELERIAQVCMRHNIWAISDEVYHPFVFADGMDAAPSIANVDGMKERTIVVESLSKTFAMTGWRIGYLLAPAQIIEHTGTIAELMQSSVNATAQYAGTAALAGPRDHIAAMREDYRVKRQIVLDELAASDVLSLIEPQGAFYAFVDIRATQLDSQDFAVRLLHDERVAVVPGDAFGHEGAGFARLSYAGDADELREGVRRLRDFAERICDPLPGSRTRAYHRMGIMA